MPIQKWSDRIWVVQLLAEPGLTDDLANVKSDLAQINPLPDLIIDMSGLASINSSNLSQLLRIRKLCIDKDRRLKIVSVRDAIWVVFLTTGLDKIFQFAPDVSTALAAFQIEPTI